MPNLDDSLKKKLGIKWKDAKRLIEEAKESLGYEQGPWDEEQEEEILEEATFIFEDYTPEEQEAMKVPDAEKEPDWKRKAREQAEKREREWEEQAAAERRRREQEALAAAHAAQNGGKPEAPKGHAVPTRVTTIKRGMNGEEIVEERIETKIIDPSTAHKHTVYCCTIL